MLRERRNGEPLQGRAVALAATGLATIVLAVVFVAVVWRASEHGSSAAHSSVAATGPASPFAGAAFPANIKAPAFTLHDQKVRACRSPSTAATWWC